MGKWDKYVIKEEPQVAESLEEQPQPISSTTDKWSKYAITSEPSNETTPVTPSISPKEAFMNFVKWGNKPLVSPETVRSNYPISAAIGSMMPIYEMASGSAYLPGGRGLDSFDFLKQGADVMSEQTSPFAIGTNIATGVGLLKAMGKFPQIMNKKWIRNVPKATTQIVDDTITNYREAYGDLLKPNYNTKITVNNTFKKLKIKNKSTIKELWSKRDELLQNMVGNAWEKSAIFERTKLAQQDAMKMIQKLKETVSSALPQETASLIEGLDAGYGEAMKLGRFIKKQVYNAKTGTYNFKKLPTIFSDIEKTSQRAAFEAFAQLNPNMNEVIKKMQKYVSRKATKKAVGRVVGRVGTATGTAAGLGLAYKVLGRPK